PEGNIARAITLINRSARPVVALDIPSGISADDGGHQAAAVQAVLTLTFAGLKRGLITGPGAALAGRVRVIPIGVPDVEVARGVTTFLLEARDVRRHFPPRPRGAHKGTYGHLLLVAGSLGKTGAAALSAASAARCLTPHPGEMARMLETGVADVERDRIECVRAFATCHGAYVVLKGAGSVIGAPDGRVFVNPTGNPGMASGGTGDVLTGMLGAFLARGLEPGAALQASVFLH